MEVVVALLSVLLLVNYGSAMPRWSCSNVTPPDNGRIEMLSYGVFAKNTAMFRFLCNDGYTLKGQCVALCVDGIVVYGKPVCVDTRKCPAMQDPPNGKMRQLTNAELVRKSNEADPDKLHAMLISMSRSATDLATIRGRVNLVQELRTTLETIKALEGLAKSAAAQPGAVIGRAPLYALECDDGYVLDSAIFYKFCQEGVFHPMSTPTCIEKSSCSHPTAPGNGTVNLYKTNRMRGKPSVVTAVFSCNRGFRMDPPESKLAHCGPDGTWSTVHPTCTMLCPGAQNPPYGRLVAKGDTMRLICNPGYKLEGPEEIFCQDDGNWGMQNSFCVPEVPCRIIENVPVGALISSTPLKKSKNNKTLEGCPEYRPCYAPSHPHHGKYTVMGDIEPPLPLSRIRFGCRDGYRLRGSPSVTCGPKGKWTDQFPVCQKIPSCPKLNRVAFGFTYWANSVPQNEHLSALVYICKTGFTLVGDPISLCVNGKWMGRKPSCVEDVYCPAIQPPINGKFVDSLPSPVARSTVVQVSCTRGYKLKGESSLLCMTSGQWSSNPPSCEPECEVPVNWENGRVSYPIHFGRFPNAFARFLCDDGFVLSGQKLMMCRDGQWSHDFPTCKATVAECPKLTAPSNGQMFTSESDGIKGARFLCDSGFVLIGSSLITCDKTGQWFGTVPACKEELKCPEIPKVAHQSHLVTSDTVTELVVVFRCDFGFQLMGPREVRCVAPGTWQGDFPECRERAPDLVDSGLFEGPIEGRG